MLRRQNTGEEMKELSAEEIEERAWKAADKLVETLEKFNQEPSKNADDLREYFASECVSLLVQRFTIPAPALTDKDEEERTGQ